MSNRRVISTIVLVLSITIGNAQSVEEIRKAKDLLASQNYEQAALSYQRIINGNPSNGEYYYHLAECFYKLERYDDAAMNYLQSFEVGFKYGTCIKKLSMCFANTGDKEKMLYWLHKGLNTPKSLTFNDILSIPEFDSFRKSDTFRSLYPKDSTLSRNKKWEKDILFLKERFERKHYDVFGQVSATEWDSDFKNLIGSIKTISDAEILVELMKITKKIGDGHTFIRPPLSGQFKFHYFPFKLFAFDEGLHVLETTEKYKETLGWRLTKIENVPIDEVVETVSQTIPVDNEFGLEERLDYNLMISEVLYVLGIIDKDKKVVFSFQNDSNESLEIIVEPGTFNPMNMTERLVDRLKEKPIYLKNENKFFWHQKLEHLNAMYLKININLSTPDRNIKEYYNEVFDSISEKKVKNLIIDIRHCPGGNSFNNKTLIQNILTNKSLDKENGIFTIIGRRTFSAAMNLATELESWTDTRFIGEPTGSKPNFIGETNFITLPNSGINVSISDAYWQKSNSWDKRNYIAPDIYAPITFQGYIDGKDPSLNAIENIILNKNNNMH
ncbi:tetratricopeptide repeat protein [Muricauda sp. NFXS6]|uniref:tetratricopeptide repeat protein n=1 Tax=Allomuricauda sp. NFXS6 TaxID=2819094 RepID=UPI0032DEDEB1